jgi:putative molybdopterin biosynthesis protein
VKSIPVGSTAGLAALGRGEGDVGGTHLLDASTGLYNQAFLPPGVRLMPGYRRRQGLAFRQDDPAFGGADDDIMLEEVRSDRHRMVNRNPGSGTRILIDGLLGGHRPPGYLHQVKTHHGVAAAIEQRRADWGVTLETVARTAGLGFHFVADEHYDFAVPEDRWDRPAVAALRHLLEDPSVRKELAERGLN